MKYKVYFEDDTDSMGGWEYVGFFKLCWWIFRGRINPSENSTVYYIRIIETEDGDRI